MLVLVAAIAVGLVAIPAAQSTQGQPIIAGQNNSASADTQLSNDAADGFGLLLWAHRAALEADSDTGIGVIAHTSSANRPAIIGQNNNVNGGVAVEGFNQAPNWVAVWGHHAQDSFGYGVEGEAPIGVGVLGKGSDSGVKGSTDSAAGSGVRAENTAGGNALTVTGKASFSRSGLITIAAGANSFTQTGVALSSSRFILATLQTKGAVFVKAAVPNPAANSFTIYLSKLAPTGGVKVAYFIGD